MTKVIIFHGGESFNSYDDYLNWLRSSSISFDSGSISWKKHLKYQLESTGQFEVMLPKLPSRENASYDEWEIVMNKLLPYIDLKTVLIGHSLGGIFLASYLAEHQLSFAQLHLIASPFESVGTFELPKILLQISLNCPDIHLWHSIDDEVVNFNEVLKYQKQLNKSSLHQYLNSGHFNQTEFPELLEVILNQNSN